MTLGRAGSAGLTCGLVGFLLVALLAGYMLFLGGASEGSAQDLDTRSVPAWDPICRTSDDGFSQADSDEVDADVPSAADLNSPAPWRMGVPIAFLIGRVRRERLLEHPVRKRIVEEVRGHPGIHHRRLLRSLAVSNGTLAYHLQMLERAGYLRAHRAHGRKYLFVPEDPVDRHLLLATEQDRELLSMLSEARAADIEELGRRSGLKGSSIAYHMGRLRTLGLVEVRREGHAFVFFHVA